MQSQSALFYLTVINQCDKLGNCRDRTSFFFLFCLLASGPAFIHSERAAAGERPALLQAVQQQPAHRHHQAIAQRQNHTTHRLWTSTAWRRPLVSTLLRFSFEPPILCNRKEQHTLFGEFTGGQGCCWFFFFFSFYCKRLARNYCN